VPRRIDYAEDAIEDLQAVQSWLTQPGSGMRASRRLTAIRSAIRQLRQHPCLFPVAQHPGVRELPCDGGYRVLYEVTPDTGHNETAGNVLILRVFGPGQDRSGL
jgi:plasmid stabilization system protein ParE